MLSITVIDGPTPIITPQGRLNLFLNTLDCSGDTIAPSILFICTYGLSHFVNRYNVLFLSMTSVVNVAGIFILYIEVFAALFDISSAVAPYIE